MDESAKRTRRPRALIVDDVDSMRQLYRKGLELDGFDVSVADGGEAAVVTLTGPPPDVVVLDFMMPGMSGTDVLRWMRAREELKDVPVVMLTADDQPESIEGGFAAGANDYVTKPVDRRILASRLRAAIKAREDGARVLKSVETERQRDRLLADVEQARILQRAQVPRMPQKIPGWAITGALQPCGEVGGDMFDVVAGKVDTLVMLDVSGHGLSSAMVASSVRSLLRLVLRSASLTDAATLVGDHLAEAEGGYYACLALVGLEGSKVSIVNAGLPPIALVDSSSGAVLRTVCGAGLPPGLFSRQTYEITTFDVETGARLVLVSDGLTEPFGSPDDVEACIPRLDLAAPTMCSAAELERRIRRLFDAGRQPDDATLLVADFDGVTR